MKNQALPPNYKWTVLGITTIGVLMVAIDTTVVILALPDIMIGLNSNLVNMVWVLMTYIFVSTVFLLGLGRVADVYGRVRLYNLGFAIFTLGSAFSGLSQSDLQLIASRAVQGLGGALLLVNALAIITEVFPPQQRGTAMGVNSMTFGTGSIIGPVLGGIILSITTWQWVFLINIPIGLVGTAVSYRYLRKIEPRRSDERLDVVGSLAFSTGLFAFLFALTEGSTEGFTSPAILALFGVFIAMLAFFVVWEQRSRCPALDLSLLQSQLFDFSVLAAMFQSLAIFAVQFLIIFYLQVVRGNSPLTAAFLLLPAPMTQAVVGPLSGRLSDVIGARIPATAGLLLQASGIFWLSTITIDTPYLHIVFGLILAGAGAGLFYSPNTSAAMGAAPGPRLGVAAATLATFRNVGMVTSYALALAVAATSLPSDTVQRLLLGTAEHLGTPLMVAFVDGMQAALRVSAIICLMGAGLSFARGSEERGR